MNGGASSQAPGRKSRRISELPCQGDYKALIGDGDACVFDDELWIASPFDHNPHVNLLRLIAEGASALSVLRHDNAVDNPIAIYPEPGGLLTWGRDGGGAEYHWNTAHADPDRWTVAVTGRPVDDPAVQQHDRTLTTYLAGLAAGDIVPAALSGWPSRNARIRRRTP